MHVAILGTGALGRVYGVRLALRAGVGVTFVVREGRAPFPLALTRIDGDHASEEIASPVFSSTVPAEADVVVVCVRAEQLDAALDAVLEAAPTIPVVMMTPVLPVDLARLTKRHGSRLRVGMPGVVAYVTDEGRCRYWLPKVAPTLLDAGPPVPEPVAELTRALAAAGFGARLELGVHETNPATTVAFIPLAMGVDAAGGIDALVGDKELLRIALGAVTEGLALAAKLGKTPAWVDLLARFAGPLALKMGLGIARSRAPEALLYVEEHFGRKLHAQNLAMARSIVALADEKGVPAASLRALSARLEAGR